MIYSVQRLYSLSGRWKAAKKAYKDGKEYYGGEEHRRSVQENIKYIKENPTERYHTSESSKKAARNYDRKSIKEEEKSLLNPKKLARRDAWYAFKSPYWEDRL